MKKELLLILAFLALLTACEPRNAQHASASTLPDPLEAGWQGNPVCEQLHQDPGQRVLRCTFPPGRGHERHFHAPHFGYAIAGGRMRIVDSSGTRDVDLPTGSSFSSAGIDWHEVMNIGETTVVYLIAETTRGTMRQAGRTEAAKDGELLAGKVAEMTGPLVAANQFSGAIVLMRDGEILYQEGFGLANREAGTSFTPETASDGGSLAKTFTAAGLQWLAYEGRVELDAPVSRYLPEYPHPQTTLRHLLSHSNGLPPYYEFFDDYFGPTDVRTTEAMLRVIAREVPVPAFTPGSRFEYSNFAFDLATLVIERVTELSYKDFLRERFFSPLDMQASFARPGRLADWSGTRTLGYRWHDGAWQFVDVFDMEAALGASNLYFSAVDLGRWASANAAGNALPDAVYAAGQQRFLIGDQPSSITGLSWYCDDDETRCYYTGDLNAFHGFVYWDRQRNEAAVFVSNSSLPPWQVITLQRGLVDALAERAVPAEPTTQFEHFDKAMRPGLVGTYVSEDMADVQISAGDNGLSMRIGSGLQFAMFPVSREVFYVPGPDYWLAFSGGQVPTTVHIRSMFLDAVARRGDEPLTSTRGSNE